MEIVYSHVCGLDVHKKKIAACIAIWEGWQEVRHLQATFGTMTKDLCSASHFARPITTHGR